MCGIVGSKKIDTFLDLKELNLPRGDFSFSYYAFDENLEIIASTRTFNAEEISVHPSAYYHIGHNQAPTNGRIQDATRIHPATTFVGSRVYHLWHNGILKFFEGDWDTMYLLHLISTEGEEKGLSSADGQFSCALHTEVEEKNTLSIFRNGSGSMFFDSEANFSTTRFAGSSMLKYNTIYTFENSEFKDTGYFKNSNAPYYIP